MAQRVTEATKQDPQFIQRCLQVPPPVLGEMDRATPNKRNYPTLHAVVFKFRTEEVTRELVARVRWPLGIECAKCHKTDIRKVESKCRRNRNLYWCLGCKKQFSITSTSPDLRVIRDLSEWFIALYLMESSPRGNPPKQLQRLLGINYRTAAKLIGWFRGKEDSRKRLFKSYIGHNDPTEYEASRKAIKNERVLIEKQKGNSLIGTDDVTKSNPQ